MKRMLIAAHARFADGLESALSLIMGKREDITCINAFVTGDQVLVITDAFFGSVNQKIMGKRLKNSLIVTGANLPLVLELVTLLDGDSPITADQLKNTVALAREQLMVVEMEDAADSSDDFDF